MTGSSAPVIRLKSTLLPAPLGPITASRSPRKMVRSTSTSTGSESNAAVTPRRSTTRLPPRSALRSWRPILRRSSTGRSTVSSFSMRRSAFLMRVVWRGSIGHRPPLFVAADGVVQAVDLLLAGAPLLLLLQQRQFAGGGIAGVVARPHPHLAGVQLGDRGDRLVQHVAIVRDHHHRSLVGADHTLQRASANSVEMRLRLVQQQQVGIGHQARRQRRQLALAAGQLGGRPVELPAG